MTETPQQNDPVNETKSLVKRSETEDFEDAIQEDEENQTTISSNSTREIQDLIKRDFAFELTTILITPLRLQHRLAYEKLGLLGQVTHTGLLILISLISGVLSFLSSSYNDGSEEELEELLAETNATRVVVVNGLNYTLDHSGANGERSLEFISEYVREILILTVGVLSIVQVAIQKVGETFNFSARSDMHQMVQMSLKKLYDQIIFEEKKLAGVGQKMDTTQLEKFQELYEQCLASSNSAMPIEIAQAFKLVEHRCMTFLTKKHQEWKKKKNNQSEPDPFQYLKRYFEFAYDELYTDITSQFWWKMFPRCPKKAVERVMMRMEEEWGYMHDDWSREIDHKCLCCCQYTKFVRPGNTNQRS